MERNFKGVWIAAEIWLDKDLTLVEKALLAEIDSFTGNGKSFIFDIGEGSVANYVASGIALKPA